MTDLVLRLETQADIAGVRAVNAAAFEADAEAALVDALREAGKFVLSLVASLNGDVVGHILFTKILMEPGGIEAGILGLGPMAVRPGSQGQGIGSALVRRGLERCRDLGFRGVVVLGHPAFYPRFGFVPASEHGITSTYDVPDEVFMAMGLGEGELPGGLAVYPPEFAGV